jgi:NAD-dependent deacetylase
MRNTMPQNAPSPKNEDFEAALAHVRRALSSATSIVVLTGAGISAESGIPTFRDAMTGLWSRFKPEDLATPEAFRRDPRTVWDWYADRRERVAQARPNSGHVAIAELEARALARGSNFLLVTQNVDGLHAAAGSRRLVELHGNIGRVKCFEHGHPAKRWTSGDSPPTCERCGSMLRPDVVWFGEMLPSDAIERAVEAAAGCDFFLCVGTSGLVEPAASLPFEALAQGALVVEVNPNGTPLSSHASVVLAGSAHSVLPRIASASG